MTARALTAASVRRLVGAALPSASLAVLLIAGCNGVEQVAVPPPPNPFADFAAGTDTTFDVVTWNLEGFASNAGSTTVDLVAQAVTALDVDVIALQEVTHDGRFPRLLDRLPGWEGWLSPGGGSYSLAYLWRSATVTVGAAGIREIFGDDDRAFPRPPAVFDLVHGGREFTLINNHLKCCGDNFLDVDSEWDEETRRRDACVALEAWIAAEAPDRAVLLLGDLNDLLTDPLAHNVFQIFLDHPLDYAFADMGAALGPPVGWSWGPGSSHLDHILVTSELFPALAQPAAGAFTVRLDGALSGGDYRDLISDHAPVAVRLDVR